jgi:hypothetical protein
VEAIAEFPFVGELPAAQVDESAMDRRQRLVKKLAMLRTMMESDGQLVPVALVAECFGLSKQRVHGIVEQGHLRKVDIHGTSYITENSLIEYLNSERRNGRPRKPSIPQMAKAAAKFASQT